MVQTAPPRNFTGIWEGDDDRTVSLVFKGKVLETWDDRGRKSTMPAEGEANVTQATSITTGVTAHGRWGKITTVAQTLAAGAEAEFAVTNRHVEVGDIVLVNVDSGSSAGDIVGHVTNITAGEFKITLTNLHASAAGDDTLGIYYYILKQ